MTRDLLLEKTKEYLGKRQQAYHRVFDRESPFVKDVLDDLAKFCRAEATTFHPDQRVHAALEGRREVWLRISQHLNLNPDELWKLYGRKDVE